ncbi:LexA family protein [Raoultella ornithinolytica]|uniref:LexA family transcriptional regulator n=1 Tax=Raoultella ornithinolytica TaxID=54291 RepID=A0A9Q9JDZ5_RAOOR|nr:LexA family transcriptional regulator [Raoultella ornithinolytica]UXE39602.1 LexA family transcriptional regulator [Raoultella ornithinolytica]
MEQTNTLTCRQKEVLNILRTYQREHGFPPTTYELTGLLGCRSPNAAATHLKALEKKGAISITRGVSRGITINEPTQKEEIISLLRSLVNGDEYAREHAIIFLESRGVQV